jgi:hypothetical protein
MKRTVVLGTCAAAFFALVVGGCTGSKLTGTWRDEAYRKPVASALVFGVTGRATVRRLFENEFVNQLQARGVQAVASYTAFPTEDRQAKEAVVAKVKELNAGAVIVTRLTDKKTIERQYPSVVMTSPGGYYGTYTDYYWQSYDLMYIPGPTYQQDVLYLETNLYDASSERLVWSALSKTVVGDAVNEEIKPFVTLVMKKLADDGLVP